MNFWKLNLLLISFLICCPGATLTADEESTDKTPIDLAKVGKYFVSHRADILLITSEELADSWTEFAQWKTKTGRPTKIVTVSQIEDSFDGNDKQAKIRQCCLDHIDSQNTRWVILGGDSRGRKGGHVTDRDTHHADFFKYKNLPTDIYYISPTDWDANDDGIYGKFDDDMEAVSYTNPKASIGRIPVRTTEDVAAYTQKVIHYESMYPEGKFAHRMMYTCAESHANPKLNSSKEILEENWAKGDIQQFFVNSTPWDQEEDGDHDLSSENWLEMFNSKAVSKIHMHGHGLNHLWVLENKSTVTAETVDELKNEYAYPVMTTVSCFTGQFDSFRDPSITESMLRKDMAGAIAIIAPSREGIPVFHDPSDMRLMMTEGKMDGTTETLTRFWKHALNSESSTIGEAFRAAKMDMETHARKTDGYHFVQCELNLLGDPTLDARSKPVEPIKVKVTRSGTKAKLSVAKDCEVCIWDGEDFYKTMKPGANGDLEFDFGDRKVDELSISVYGKDRNTKSLELPADPK